MSDAEAPKKPSLEELEYLSTKPIRTMDELIILAYAVPELIARVRELERMVDIMTEDMGDSSHADGYYRVCKGCKDADNFGIGGCGKDCLKMLYEQAAKEAGE